MCICPPFIMSSGTAVRGPMYPGGTVVDGTSEEQGTFEIRLEATWQHGKVELRFLIKFHLFILMCVQLHSLLMKQLGSGCHASLLCLNTKCHNYNQKAVWLSCTLFYSVLFRFLWHPNHRSTCKPYRSVLNTVANICHVWVSLSPFFSPRGKLRSCLIFISAVLCVFVIEGHVKKELLALRMESVGVWSGSYILWEFVPQPRTDLKKTLSLMQRDLPWLWTAALCLRNRVVDYGSHAGASGNLLSILGPDYWISWR